MHLFSHLLPELFIFIAEHANYQNVLRLATNIIKIQVTMAAFLVSTDLLKMVKVLFVCMGNICRSPTAEGVFRNIVQQAGLQDRIHIDSAGTHAYHVGNEPDPRAQAAARKRNIDLSSQRARRVEAEDIDHFDYVLAMDDNNLADLEYILSGDPSDKLSLFLEFSKNSSQREVPDPYYGGDQGFELVLDLIEDASTGLLDDIRQKHSL